MYSWVYTLYFFCYQFVMCVRRFLDVHSSKDRITLLLRILHEDTMYVMMCVLFTSLLTGPLQYAVQNNEIYPILLLQER